MAEGGQARVGPRSAEALGSEVAISTDRGSLRFPVVVEPTMVDGVVWVPARSFGRGVLAELASPGSPVTVKGAN